MERKPDAPPIDLESSIGALVTRSMIKEGIINGGRPGLLRELWKIYNLSSASKKKIEAEGITADQFIISKIDDTIFANVGFDDFNWDEIAAVIARSIEYEKAKRPGEKPTRLPRVARRYLLIATALTGIAGHSALAAAEGPPYPHFCLKRQGRMSGVNTQTLFRD